MTDTHVARVARLFEAVAPDYDQHVPFFRAFAHELVDWLGVVRGLRVLDVGSGRGAVTDAATRAGATVVSVDLAMAMLRHASGRRVRADVRTLPVRPRSFDLVVGVFSIHLLPDPVVGLREAANAAAPGGRVAIALGSPTIDPDWQFVGETLLAHASRATREPTMPPPTPIADVRALFGDAGLHDVRVGERTVSVPVASPESFLRGEQSHGYRSLFDIYDDDVRAEVERELLDRLRDLERRGRSSCAGPPRSSAVAWPTRSRSPARRPRRARRR